MVWGKDTSVIEESGVSQAYCTSFILLLNI